MLIDCDSCQARPSACGDCVVSYLLATTDARPGAGRGVALDDGAWAAVSTLAAAGLVPPLRLVPDRTRVADVTSSGRSSPPVPLVTRQRDDTPEQHQDLPREQDIA